MAWRQTQRRNTVRPLQLDRDREQAMTQSLQGSPPQMGPNTETFEPARQAVGQQDDPEESLVRWKVFVGISPEA
jgi:hypothetical protein